MEQYDYERLEQLGELLFQEGSFFSAMSEDEKEWFGEALQLLARSEAEKVMQEQCPCNTGDCCNNEGPKDSLGELVDLIKDGFNLQVSAYLNPNNPYPADCPPCDPVYDTYHDEPIKDSYYTNVKDEEYMADGTYVPSPEDEYIADGKYDAKPEDEMLYGEDQEVKPEDKDGNWEDR